MNEKLNKETSKKLNTKISINYYTKKNSKKQKTTKAYGSNSKTCILSIMRLKHNGRIAEHQQKQGSQMKKGAK